MLDVVRTCLRVGKEVNFEEEVESEICPAAQLELSTNSEVAFGSVAYLPPEWKTVAHLEFSEKVRLSESLAAFSGVCRT